MKDNESAEVAVLAITAHNPHISVLDKYRSRDSGISKAGILRTLKGHLLHPYHISLRQELYGNDFINQVEFC